MQINTDTETLTIAKRNTIKAIKFAHLYPHNCNDICGLFFAEQINPGDRVRISHKWQDVVSVKI